MHLVPCIQITLQIQRRLCKSLSRSIPPPRVPQAPVTTHHPLFTQGTAGCFLCSSRLRIHVPSTAAELWRPASMCSRVRRRRAGTRPIGKSPGESPGIR